MTTTGIWGRTGLGRSSIIALAACGLAGAALAAPADRAQVAAGRRILDRDCAACHAIGPRGQSLRQTAPPFRDLHRRYDVAGLEEALAEGIMVGHAAMPAKAYAAKDIEAMIAYLKSLEVQPASSVARR